jgi:hypothetical protein
MKSCTCSWNITTCGPKTRDTAAVFFGVGWPILNGQRSWDSYASGSGVRYTRRLGYLDLPEYGYVLGKRSCVFDEDIAPWLTAGPARTAYTRGRAVAAHEWRLPPLSSASPASSRRYEKAKKRALRRADHGTARRHSASNGSGYRFTGGSPLKVTFPCPACGVNIKMPVDQQVQLRCEVCRSELECAE